MVASKIFTGYWYGILNPWAGPPAPAASTRICDFNIQNTGRQMNLKSLIINHDLSNFNNPTPPIPNELNTFVEFRLSVFPTVIGIVPASVFTVTGGTIDFTGSQFDLTRSGQYHFEKLFLENNIRFRLTIQNYDSLNQYFYHYNLVAEIE